MKNISPSPSQIEAAKTPKGGWTRAQLSAWGVKWPPPKGWRRELEKNWKSESRNEIKS